MLDELGDPSEGRAVGDGRLVDLDRLRDLLAHPPDGVKTVHGALEDDGRVVPSGRPQPPEAHRQDVFAVEEDLPLDLGSLGEEPQQRVGDGRLAAPRLAGEPQGLALIHPEVHPPHRGDRAHLGLVGHLEVPHLENAHGAVTDGEASD
jgi:hypothetical protein